MNIMNDKERAISAYIVSHKNDTPNDALRIGKAFNDGAEWADRTMLDKVCEWLKENVRVFQKEDIGDFILANLRKEMMR